MMTSKQDNIEVKVDEGENTESMPVDTSKQSNTCYSGFTDLDFLRQAILGLVSISLFCTPAVRASLGTDAWQLPYTAIKMNPWSTISWYAYR